MPQPLFTSANFSARPQFTPRLAQDLRSTEHAPASVHQRKLQCSATVHAQTGTRSEIPRPCPSLCSPVQTSVLGHSAPRLAQELRSPGNAPASVHQRKLQFSDTVHTQNGTRPEIPRQYPSLCSPVQTSVLGQFTPRLAQDLRSPDHATASVHQRKLQCSATVHTQTGTRFEISRPCPSLCSPVQTSARPQSTPRLAQYLRFPGNAPASVDQCKLQCSAQFTPRLAQDLRSTGHATASVHQRKLQCSATVHTQTGTRPEIPRQCPSFCSPVQTSVLSQFTPRLAQDLRSPDHAPASVHQRKLQCSATVHTQTGTIPEIPWQCPSLCSPVETSVLGHSSPRLAQDRRSPGNAPASVHQCKLQCSASSHPDWHKTCDPQTMPQPLFTNTNFSARPQSTSRLAQNRRSPGHAPASVHQCKLQCSATVHPDWHKTGDHQAMPQPLFTNANFSARPQSTPRLAQDRRSPGNAPASVHQCKLQCSATVHPDWHKTGDPQAMPQPLFTSANFSARPVHTQIGTRPAIPRPCPSLCSLTQTSVLDHSPHPDWHKTGDPQAMPQPLFTDANFSGRPQFTPRLAQDLRSPGHATASVHQHKLQCSATVRTQTGTRFQIPKQCLSLCSPTQTLVLSHSSHPDWHKI
ncbi:hypothetical protein NDU88_007016 [Pleurodeles waltl]|uniref:Uncharacterized protein n=1 Tax=Pleurodeles waltl TaxID=8319 RepID=A0AAV7WI01_PLEWA|nr:hypothetical protein NDU88_007016 [Pleurodeles waltl]